MSKILQSLPLTIVAGIVLTVIMAFVTDAMVSSPNDLTGPLDRASGTLNDMTD